MCWCAVKKLLTHSAVKHVELCWIPSHIGITVNEKADAAGKAALSQQITYCKLPATDLCPSISQHCSSESQVSWNCSTSNKLHAIIPVVGSNVIKQLESSWFLSNEKSRDWTYQAYSFTSSFWWTTTNLLCMLNSTHCSTFYDGLSTSYCQESKLFYCLITWRLVLSCQCSCSCWFNQPYWILQSFLLFHTPIFNLCIFILYFKPHTFIFHTHVFYYHYFVFYS